MEEEMGKKPLVFAYYVSGHGFGHATRVVEVVRNLILSGHKVHVVTGAPDYIFTTEIQSPKLFIRKVLLDCGAVQADALTVDRVASLEKVWLMKNLSVDSKAGMSTTKHSAFIVLKYFYFYLSFCLEGIAVV